MASERSGAISLYAGRAEEAVLMVWINATLGTPLGIIMRLCYQWTGNYGGSILLFTLISKVILLPLSIVVQKNSIKMIRMQPELNRITIEHYGDKDAITDGSMELYKREKYSPMLGIVPLVIQILLVLGLISVIYNPLQHLLGIDRQTCSLLTEATAQLMQVEHLGSGGQLTAMAALGDPANRDFFMGLAPSVSGLPEIMTAAARVDTHFLGLDLAQVPPLLPLGVLSLIPLLSCLSTLLLCWAQNRENVLQKEQSFWGRWGSALFTVAFSTYFTFLVPAGVGMYWIASNLFALGILYLMNFLYPPAKYIDYGALEETKRELSRMKEAESRRKAGLAPFKKREKADYRRFLNGKEPKKLVFYSEGSGFYKYFAGMIGYVRSHSDLVIHYITSDPRDPVFDMEAQDFQVYYIGEMRLIPLMMKMDADMVIMTVPDLELFHLKRSLVRKDIEYIYADHAVGSDNLMCRTHGLDHYDTLFSVGPHQVAEARATEELYHLKPRRLVKVGYSLLDEMTAAWEASPKQVHDKKTILIAPSWQQDNIMDSCLDQLVQQFLPLGARLIIRPHPQYVRLYPERIAAVEARYREQFGEDFILQTDFSSTDTVYNSDLLITDWSNVAFEFAFSTCKPVLFINTPMKVMNPEYQKIPVEPFEIRIRADLGGELELGELNRAGAAAADLLSRPEEFREHIRQVRAREIFNPGHGAEAAGRYIISRLCRDPQQTKRDEQ